MNPFKIFCILCLLATCRLVSVAQSGQVKNLYVSEGINTKTPYTVSELKKIYFVGTNYVVQQKNNTSKTHTSAGTNSWTFALGMQSTVAGTNTISGANTLSGANTISGTNTLTGWSEQSGKVNTDFVIYPSPAMDFLNVKSPLPNAAEFQISIFDTKGTHFFTFKNLKESLVNLDCSSLPPGLYICQLRSKNSIYSTYFIKH